MSTQVAFLFPGQGSQSVGMGADVFTTSTAARQVFETVDEALGFPLSSLWFQGPEDKLRDRINAQPAIVSVRLALFAAFQEALSPHNCSWALPLVTSHTTFSKRSISLACYGTSRYRPGTSNSLNSNTGRSYPRHREYPCRPTH